EVDTASPVPGLAPAGASHRENRAAQRPITAAPRAPFGGRTRRFASNRRTIANSTSQVPGVEPLQLSHSDVAELDQVVVAVVLQTDVPVDELTQVGRRVTVPGRLLAGGVVELVDHTPVAEDGVVLPLHADFVFVPLVFGCHTRLAVVHRIEVVDRPGLLRFSRLAVVDLDLVSTVDGNPGLGVPGGALGATTAHRAFVDRGSRIGEPDEDTTVRPVFAGCDVAELQFE